MNISQNFSLLTVIFIVILWVLIFHTWFYRSSASWTGFSYLSSTETPVYEPCVSNLLLNFAKTFWVILWLFTILSVVRLVLRLAFLFASRSAFILISHNFPLDNIVRRENSFIHRNKNFFIFIFGGKITANYFAFCSVTYSTSMRPYKNARPSCIFLAKT